LILAAFSRVGDVSLGIVARGGVSLALSPGFGWQLSASVQPDAMFVLLPEAQLTGKSMTSMSRDTKCPVTLIPFAAMNLSLK
jgi:hypothetical protein